MGFVFGVLSLGSGFILAELHGLGFESLVQFYYNLSELIFLSCISLAEKSELGFKIHKQLFIVEVFLHLSIPHKVEYKVEGDARND